MRILKYLALGLLGYALYEGYRMLYARFRRTGDSGRPRRELEKALNEEQGRMAVLTGPDRGNEGSGRTVATVNADGGSTPTVVGRGVVHR